MLAFSIFSLIDLLFFCQPHFINVLTYKWFFSLILNKRWVPFHLNFSVSLQPNSSLGRPIMIFLDQTQTHELASAHARTIGLLSTCDQLVWMSATCTNTQSTQEANILAISRIWTCDPSNQVGSYLSLRPQGHREQTLAPIIQVNFILTNIFNNICVLEWNLSVPTSLQQVEWQEVYLKGFRNDRWSGHVAMSLNQRKMVWKDRT